MSWLLIIEVTLPIVRALHEPVETRLDEIEALIRERR